MMGGLLKDTNVPVIKGTNGVIAIDTDTTKEVSCIKCGRCVVVCPTKSREFKGMAYTMASIKFNMAYKERREPEMYFARYN